MKRVAGIALGGQIAILAGHMKLKLLATLFVLCGVLVFRIQAAEEAKPAPAEAAKSALANEVRALVEKIQAKAQAGPVTEAALADELAAFDRLLDAHKAEKTDAVAQVLVMKGALYLQLLNDFDKAAAVFRQLRTDFPESSQAKEVDDVLKAIATQQAAARAQEALKPGLPFPDFDEKDLDGNPLSVGKLKGNVVLVDFWATWCGPCVEEMPHVISLYKKYHARGFEIVGVSLDRDEAALKKFIADKQMTWPQFFDGQFWDNKLASRYGVTSIPFTVLVDGDGRIVGKNLRGPQLDAELERLLGP